MTRPKAWTSPHLLLTPSGTSSSVCTALASPRHSSTHSPSPPDLNTPKSNPMPLRPHAMIAALSQHSARKQNLFGSREHQDAQELFQLVSECVKDEALAVVKESRRDKGFGGLPPLDAALDSAQNGDLAKNVFDGLTANRRSCTECGYTEAVMHFGFDSWQLAVPRSGVRSPLTLHHRQQT